MAQTITADDVRPGDVVELLARPGELLVVSRVRPGNDDETVRLSVGRYTSPWDESSRAGCRHLRGQPQPEAPTSRREWLTRSTLKAGLEDCYGPRAANTNTGRDVLKKPLAQYSAQSRRMCMRDLATRRRSSPAHLRTTSS